jgi:hypothetical protein
LTPLRLRACIEKQATEVRSGYTRHQTKAKLGQTSKRPIIFVAHNLGDNIVKAELVLWQQMREGRRRKNKAEEGRARQRKEEQGKGRKRKAEEGSG